MYVPLLLCPHAAAANTKGCSSLKQWKMLGAPSPTASETSAGMPVLPHHWTLRHSYTGAGLAAAATVTGRPKLPTSGHTARATRIGHLGSQG